MQIPSSPGHEGPDTPLVASEPSPVETPATPSFERVYDENIELILRSIRRLGVVDSAVDDVAQQALLVIHRRLPEFEGRSSLRTWIFAIVLRVVREHRRSVRRKSPHWLSAPIDPEDLTDTAEDPFESLSRAQASRVIDELLLALEEDKRVVFVLADLEQLSAIEIGQVTGLDPKVVYTRLRAARTDFDRAVERYKKQMKGASFNSASSPSRGGKV
jgi:RNA polymerase sigma-70 factor (ECF subfamily)